MVSSEQVLKQRMSALLETLKGRKKYSELSPVELSELRTFRADCEKDSRPREIWVDKVDTEERRLIKADEDDNFRATGGFNDRGDPTMGPLS